MWKGKGDRMNGMFEVIQGESCEWFENVLQAVRKANGNKLSFLKEQRNEWLQDLNEIFCG